MIDLDELTRINNAGDRYGHITPGVVAELIDEVRRLREALSTPVFTCGYSQCVNALVGLEGAHMDVAEDVFMNSSQPLTVYYGEKRVFTSMAEFCAAHPREPK